MQGTRHFFRRAERARRRGSQDILKATIVARTIEARPTIEITTAHQASPNGRASSSNDQAERRCLPSMIRVSATSSGFTKNHPACPKALKPAKTRAMQPDIAPQRVGQRCDRHKLPPHSTRSSSSHRPLSSPAAFSPFQYRSIS